MNERITLLAGEVGRALSHRHWSLVVAESCTGGGIGEAVTRVSGSSTWFDVAFVTYSNAAKVRVLGVPETLLMTLGAVHEDVAAAMAQGALTMAPLARVALAVTGIAGPGGGSPEKPVGTVCFAWYVPGRAMATQTTRFEGDRPQVREGTILHALGVLRDMLALPQSRTGQA